MIDLNDSALDGQNVTIFNNGKASANVEAEISIEKKAEEAKQGSPDYKVVYKSENGGTTESAFWYPVKREGQTDEKFEENILKTAKKLRNIILAVDSSFEFPKFKTPEEMLDSCAKKIKKHNGQKVRVAVSYGSMYKAFKYLKPISEVGTVPFIENIEVEESKLTLDPNYHILERPAPDNEEDLGGDDLGAGSKDAGEDTNW